MANMIFLKPPEGTMDPEYRCKQHLVCRSPYMDMALFFAFGMHRKCMPSVSDKIDNRVYPTQADRLRDQLPALLNFLNRERNANNNSSTLPLVQLIHVQIGSNLWDLSRGCNNHGGVPDAFAQEYVRGIHEMHAAVSELLHGVPIFWQTGFPVSTAYSLKNQLTNRGHVISNQRVLNQLLHQTVTQDNTTMMGRFLDMWSVVQQAPTDCSVLEDGRHYYSCPSFAFVNKWLDAIKRWIPKSKTQLT